MHKWRVTTRSRGKQENNQAQKGQVRSPDHDCTLYSAFCLGSLLPCSGRDTVIDHFPTAPNSLSDDKILYLLKLEQFADEK